MEVTQRTKLGRVASKLSTFFNRRMELPDSRNKEFRKLSTFAQPIATFAVSAEQANQNFRRFVLTNFAAENILLRTLDLI
jgi:hypothetical protein